MAKVFIAHAPDSYNASAGVGRSLLEAFYDLKSYNEEVTIDNTEFYEAEKIDVEFQIVKKDVVSKIAQKKTCERN